MLLIYPCSDFLALEPGRTSASTQVSSSRAPPNSYQTRESRQDSSSPRLRGSHCKWAYRQIFSSLQASSKGSISKHHGFPGSNKATDNTRMYPPLASSHSQTSVGKGHERSKSDVAGIKLSAESSSVTSLTSLKKGHISNGKYLSIAMKSFFLAC